MANDTPTKDAAWPVSAEDTVRAGYPTDKLEIEDNATPEEEISFPTGPKLWLTVATLRVTI
jgi:hypothetical protein